MHYKIKCKYVHYRYKLRRWLSLWLHSQAPTQLFTACSREKWREHLLHEHDKIEKWFRMKNEVSHLFNQLQVQCTVCMTVAPH